MPRRTLHSVDDMHIQPSDLGLVARVAGLVTIAMLATIVGGQLDLDGFHRAAIVTAAMMVAGGLVAAFLGVHAEGRSLESIAQPLTAEDEPGSSSDDDREPQKV